MGSPRLVDQTVIAASAIAVTRAATPAVTSDEMGVTTMLDGFSPGNGSRRRTDHHAASRAKSAPIAAPPSSGTPTSITDATHNDRDEKPMRDSIEVRQPPSAAARFDDQHLQGDHRARNQDAEGAERDVRPTLCAVRDHVEHILDSLGRPDPSALGEDLLDRVGGRTAHPDGVVRSELFRRKCSPVDDSHDRPLLVAGEELGHRDSLERQLAVARSGLDDERLTDSRRVVTDEDHRTRPRVARPTNGLDQLVERCAGCVVTPDDRLCEGIRIDDQHIDSVALERRIDALHRGRSVGDASRHLGRTVGHDRQIGTDVQRCLVDQLLIGARRQDASQDERPTGQRDGRHHRGA